MREGFDIYLSLHNQKTDEVIRLFWNSCGQSQPVHVGNFSFEHSVDHSLLSNEALSSKLGGLDVDFVHRPTPTCPGKTTGLRVRAACFVTGDPALAQQLTQGSMQLVTSQGEMDKGRRRPTTASRT